MENIEYIPKKETIEGFVGLVLLILYTILIVTIFGLVRCAFLMGKNVIITDSDTLDNRQTSDIEVSYCSTEVVSPKVSHV